VSQNNNFAFVGVDSSIHLVNFTNPSNITLIQSLALSGTSINAAMNTSSLNTTKGSATKVKLSSDEKTLFVAIGGSGFAIVDVSNINNLTILGTNNQLSLSFHCTS
jgi:hypothetical protein